MIYQHLRNERALLEKQLFWLDISFRECSHVGIKKEYSIDEFGRFETLCSRYARTMDFLIRKTFRTLDAYEFENQGTLIDVVNNAHKRGLFESIEELRVMKDIRNTIAHEYIEEELADTFEEVLQYSEKLIGIAKTTLEYIDKAEQK